MTDSALSDRIKAMVTLLEDKTTLFDDSAAQGAVHELNGVSTFQRRNLLMSMEGVLDLLTPMPGVFRFDLS